MTQEQKDAMEQALIKGIMHEIEHPPIEVGLGRLWELSNILFDKFYTSVGLNNETQDTKIVSTMTGSCKL